jgi:hypothetical protein
MDVQREEYQKQLVGVLESLKGSVQEFTYDKKSLSMLLAGLQQFLESAYGKDVGYCFSTYSYGILQEKYVVLH